MCPSVNACPNLSRVLPYQKMCSKARSPSIDHDRIDLILRHLLHPEEKQEKACVVAPARPSSDLPAAAPEATAVDHRERSQHAAETSVTDAAVASLHAGDKGLEGRKSEWRLVYPAGDGGEGLEGQCNSEWRQVYPREGVEEEPLAVVEGSRRPRDGIASIVQRHMPGDGDGGVGHPKGQAGVMDERDQKSLWAWAECGGAPTGRLLSLLSLKIAACGEALIPCVLRGFFWSSKAFVRWVRRRGGRYRDVGAWAV